MDLINIAAALPAFGWAFHGSVLARRLSVARRDPLTGLHTRAGFTARAERIVARAPRAMAFLVDLNDFKAINDTHGHLAGDAVIASTAERLANWAAGNAITARLGGDEFAALVPDSTNHPGAAALDHALRQPVIYRGHVINVSASVGFCSVADLPVRTLTDALAAADTAMYAAKGHGRRNNTPRP